MLAPSDDHSGQRRGTCAGRTPKARGGAGLCPSAPLTSHRTTRSVRLGTDEHGAGALGPGIFREHAESARHFLVGLENAAEVATEAILVELVGGCRIPQAAAVGADLVGQHDAHLLVVVEAAELDLEVDEADADAEEKADKEVVDAQRQRHHFVDLRRRGPAEGRDVFFGDHGVAEGVVLVIEFDD